MSANELSDFTFVRLRRIQFNLLVLLALLDEIFVIDGLLLVVKDLAIREADEEELLGDQLIAIGAELDA